MIFKHVLRKAKYFYYLLYNLTLAIMARHYSVIMIYDYLNKKMDSTYNFIMNRVPTQVKLPGICQAVHFVRT